jgi:hypothetical protein
MKPRLTNLSVRLFALAALFHGSLALAQEPTTSASAPNARLGAAHQWAFSTDGTFSAQRRSQSDHDGAVTTLSVIPAIDYFLIPHLSLGAFFGIDYSRTGDVHATRLSFGPRAGFQFPLSERWSLWPRGGVSFAFTDSSVGSSQNAIALNLFLPILFEPAPHFFGGLGPFLDTDLSGDSRATVWGLKITAGGWL